MILVQSMRPSFLWRASPTQPPSSKSLLVWCKQKGTPTRSQWSRRYRCRSVRRLEKLKDGIPPPSWGSGWSCHDAPQPIGPIKCYEPASDCHNNSCSAGGFIRHVTASAAFLDGILLPSPTRKTIKTSHQKQIDRHAQTHKRQEAIVVACTAGKHFFQWGEGCTLRWTMKAREAEVTKKEKERKQRKEFHERREAALIVLDRLEHELDGDVDWLCDGDLKLLLHWKGVPIPKMGNMAQLSVCTIKKCQRWRWRWRRGEQPLPMDRRLWVWLRVAKNSPINIGDTAYWRFEAQKKRDVEPMLEAIWILSQYAYCDVQYAYCRKF